jgi:DNA (cytosine-5)-methyltransferase 1
MRTVDLFSGCGGMSLGFQNAGFEVIAAFDKWEPAVKVYKENFDHPIYNFDLSTDESKSFIADLKPELIIGGPPLPRFFKRREEGRNLGKGRFDFILCQNCGIRQARMVCYGKCG